MFETLFVSKVCYFSMLNCCFCAFFLSILLVLEVFYICYEDISFVLEILFGFFSFLISKIFSVPSSNDFLKIIQEIFVLNQNIFIS